MGQSLKHKFEGHENEVALLTKLLGRHKAMDKVGVKDYIAFSKFIEDYTQDPHFGQSPLMGFFDGDKDALTVILDRFITTLTQRTLELAEAKKQIGDLKEQIEEQKRLLELRNIWTKGDVCNRLALALEQNE